MKYIELPENEIIDMYLSNDYKMKELCEYFNVSKPKILSILKKNNIELKSAIKYKYNDNIFENIDNEESAYWLGFLYADGYVRSDNKRGNELKLKLGIKDKEHLLKFKKFISNDNIPITYEKYKNSKCYKISIHSKRIVNDLIKLGCTNRKSLTIEFPEIKDEFKNHFIRGYFDGDGSICYSQKILLLNFVSGSFKFLNEISNVFESIGTKKSNLVGSSDNYKYIQFSKKDDLYKIYYYMYVNSNIFLDRKKEKYDYVINNHRKILDDINLNSRLSYKNKIK